VDFTDALAAARELGLAGAEVAATAGLAGCQGGDAAAAVAAIEAHAARVPVLTLLAARLTLWRATGDRSHLSEAKQLADGIVAKNPPEVHADLLANVPAIRDVATACRDERVP
jgi:hypothetical protein